MEGLNESRGKNEIACNFYRAIDRTTLKAEIAAKFTTDVYCVVAGRSLKGRLSEKRESNAFGPQVSITQYQEFWPF